MIYYNNYIFILIWWFQGVSHYLFSSQNINVVDIIGVTDVLIIVRFFFNLPYFLMIIIGIIIGVIIDIIKVYKVVIKVIIDIEIDIDKDNMLNINKSGFLAIIIVSVNDNNIKWL